MSSRPYSHPRIIATSLALLVALYPALALAGTPSLAGPSSSRTPHTAGATGPRVIRHASVRGPWPRVAMRAVDYANPHVRYRLVGGLVQRSQDGGATWTAVLAPGAPSWARDGTCHPGRYTSVTALHVTGLFPGTLFVASTGMTGPVTGTSSAGPCGATGGLYVVRPDGHGATRTSDSLAAGLPYVQDASGRGPRAYSLRAVVGDPTNPNLFYAQALWPAHTWLGRRTPAPGLYRSLDGGVSWQPALTGLPVTGTLSSAPQTLSINPAHGALVLDALGPALFRSTVHGRRWTRVDAVHARRALTLYVNPANPLLTYAVTDLGVYHSRDAGATWRPLPLARSTATTILRLSFDQQQPAAVIVVPRRGRPWRVVEAGSPAPPRFDLSLTLTPQIYDRVVFSLHGAPGRRAHLRVLRGALSVSADLFTDSAGFGYARVRLQGHVTPRALQVAVAIDGRTQVLKPWLPPHWVPGSPPPPPATPTPRPTDTPTSTNTPTVTPTAAPSATPSAAAGIPTIVAPTAYPNSSLDQTWAWKPLTSTLPLCPVPTTPPTVTATISTTAIPPSASATLAAVTPTAVTTDVTLTTTPTLAPNETSTTTPTIAPTATPTSTPTTAPTATATNTPLPTATSTPVGPCTVNPPSPRQDYAAGWDNSARRLYVFGGSDSRTAVSFNDISSYSVITNAWIGIVPAAPTVPSPRYGVAGVWDPAINALLVFGGMIGAGAYARFNNDVWSFSPGSNTWSVLSRNGAAGAPTPRAHAAVSWDAAGNRLLVFGGQTNDSATPALTNDLWSFTPSGTGGTWTQLAANTGSQSSPPPRQAAQVAWDAAANSLRLFGGKNPGGGAMSDTWTWSAAHAWQFENVPDQPPGRQAAGYYWDDTHGRFVVGPGVSMRGDSDDVWYYHTGARTWRQMTTAAGAVPPPRQMARMVWDGADNQALLFGGRQQGTGASSDLWALVPTGAPGAPPARPSPRRVTKAVDVGQVVADSSNAVLLTSAKAQQAAASHAAYARVSFYIGYGQSVWTPARLHAYEQVISLLARNGLGVLAVATDGITSGWGATNWTQNAQETSGGNGENAAILDYASKLAALAQHFRAAPFRVRQWEIWNEPNVALSQCATVDLSCLQRPSLEPSNFAALLAEAYRAVKSNAATRDVQLVSGGIFGHSIAGAYNSGASGADYLARTFDEGVNRTGIWPGIKAAFGSYPFDAVGEHLYVDQGLRTTPAVIGTYLDWFHAAYAPFDVNGAGTVITEAGWRTGDVRQRVSTDMQALNLGVAFSAARRAGYVRDLCWFALADEPGYLNNTSWGLIDRFGRPKPAYAEFQRQ